MAALRIGFVGAGNMAQALAKGFISAGITEPRHIVASCPKTDDHLLQHMVDLGCDTTYSNQDVAAAADVVIVCVKPTLVPRVLHDLKHCVSPSRPLVTSVALGVTVAAMEASMPPLTRVVRIMPNTPALVQMAASVFSRGTYATHDDALLTHRLLSSVGECDEVQETFMDAVTGLSGAGPAYMYVVMEALADGGVKMGLPRPLAQKLAAQTMMGSAKMVLATDKHPAQLKDEVCSPGGCTIQGVHALERGSLRSSLIDAVAAATNTSIAAAAGK
ncbi:pyrroline-5-carboxylate reductase 3 isoform X2 [Procambarus clarkii]|uniref:pyrroline-5-carboxylate reductase 3 isoform X1 n=1 Tax=Procambarus clarkii TaxID=6728 RepID=UPI001E676A88|nr:pyrroline-5-carboxylate reductase 3-like [Procambarus clarkii]